MRTDRPGIEVRTGDRAAAVAGEPHPLAIVLDRLRSAYNVGNIFRLAEVARVREVVTCGYTATPPHPKLIKTARGCDALVPHRHFETAAAAVTQLKAEGYALVSVETVVDAPALWQAEFRFPLALVFGNEALGVHPDALALCDGFVRLPVYGRKNSLNVSNCAAVVVYEALERLHRRP